MGQHFVELLYHCSSISPILSTLTRPWCVLRYLWWSTHVTPQSVTLHLSQGTVRTEDMATLGHVTLCERHQTHRTGVDTVTNYWTGHDDTRGACRETQVLVVKVST